VTESTERTSEKPSEQIRTAQAPSRAFAESPLLSDDTRHGLVRLAYRLVWNLEDAEDAVQEALHAAEARRTQLRQSERWWRWLCKIVVQKCHAQGRAKERRRRHLDRYLVDRPAPSEPRPDQSAETQAVRSMLPKLPPRQRDVLVLRHLQGLNDGEIAEILDIAPATVRVHARAARESLCALLKQRHPDWFDPDRES